MAMSRSRLNVILSQSNSKHPARRSLEEALAAALLVEPGVDLAVIPHLYDIAPEHTGRLFLESVGGDMVVLSWLFPRAAFWLLDRDGIKGLPGESQIQSAADDSEEDEDEAAQPPRGIGPAGAVPERHIYCLNLNDATDYQVFVAEIQRIAAECRERREARDAERAKLNPAIVALGVPEVPSSSGNGQAAARFTPEQLLAVPERRWYPVIDYSRCTNCLECLDFCLFGVYGVDSLERILVETQDNCKRGCPACSRVCPEQAIMFPDFKSPAIAGAPVGAVGALKIDLTRLFGGDGTDAMTQAVAERDRELVADGRAAVGMSVGIPRRQTGKPAAPRDDLDKLVDDLEALGF
jgi:NAD-dependent dihydropyrimidine dehydrogenase PreA subunit